MNQVSDPVSDAPAAPARRGRQLAQARESCGLSIVEVARQIRLSPSQVEALETGDYTRLPGAVFVRGFIRNYARLVKVDSAQLLTGADLQFPAENLAQQDASKPVDIPFPTGRKLGWHKLAVAGSMALVLLATYEFLGSDGSEVAVEPHPVALPQAQAVAAEQDAPAGATPQGPAVSDVVTESTHETVSAQATSIAPETPPTPPPVAALVGTSREHLLKMKFERNSWVEIRDRNGRRIFSQLNSAGTAQEVSGLPPLSLVVGNAVGVHLTHNDQPVNLIPHIKVDVARLTLE